MSGVRKINVVPVTPLSTALANAIWCCTGPTGHILVGAYGRRASPKRPTSRERKETWVLGNARRAVVLLACRVS
jgi:hypothetical protein